MGQAAEILLHKLHAVQRRQAEEGGVIGGDVDLLGGKGRAVQLEKAVDAVRQRGAVELVGGGKQRLFQLAVEGTGGLQLAGPAAYSAASGSRRRRSTASSGVGPAFNSSETM